ncbi:MAG: DUF433 domain-containing protein, partial [Bacteroidota bacterium]
MTVDPHDKACFTETRILVTVILDNLATGLTADRIRDRYLSLTTEQLDAS